jgi:hypothetical protein
MVETAFDKQAAPGYSAARRSGLFYKCIKSLKNRLRLIWKRSLGRSARTACGSTRAALPMVATHFGVTMPLARGETRGYVFNRNTYLFTMLALQLRALNRHVERR